MKKQINVLILISLINSTGVNSVFANTAIAQNSKAVVIKEGPYKSITVEYAQDEGLKIDWKQLQLEDSKMYETLKKQYEKLNKEHQDLEALAAIQMLRVIGANNAMLKVTPIEVYKKVILDAKNNEGASGVSEVILSTPTMAINALSMYLFSGGEYVKNFSTHEGGGNFEGSYFSSLANLVVGPVFLNFFEDGLMKRPSKSELIAFRSSLFLFLHANSTVSSAENFGEARGDLNSERANDIQKDEYLRRQHFENTLSIKHILYKLLPDLSENEIALRIQWAEKESDQIQRLRILFDGCNDIDDTLNLFEAFAILQQEGKVGPNKKTQQLGLPENLSEDSNNKKRIIYAFYKEKEESSFTLSKIGVTGLGDVQARAEKFKNNWSDFISACEKLATRIETKQEEQK